MGSKPNITCIACAIFRPEIETLRKTLDLDLHYLPSMLHMKPAQLQLRLDSLINEQQKKGNKILLLYGDCHAGMYEHEQQPSVGRTVGINCPEILLGKEKYRSLRKEGAFFFLPEWTMRWREIFEHELGLNEKNAKDFMGEYHTKLIYLDTGIMPVQEENMNAVSTYTGLSWEVVKVSSKYLSQTIKDSIKRLKDYD